jgi:hypothetical protein
MSMAFSRYRYGHRGENNACEVPGRHGLLLTIFIFRMVDVRPSLTNLYQLDSLASLKAAEHIYENSGSDDGVQLRALIRRHSPLPLMTPAFPFLHAFRPATQ